MLMYNYSKDPRLLAELEQTKTRLATYEHIVRSHRLLPPKAPSHASFLHCTKPRDFGLYYLIHYSTKLNKDKQELINFSTYQPLSKQPSWEILHSPSNDTQYLPTSRIL